MFTLFFKGSEHQFLAKYKLDFFIRKVKLHQPIEITFFHAYRIVINSVRQTNSASSNLSLNIQGHVEVPKSKFFLEKNMSVSCNQPLYVKI